jgi:hypothetical protein
MAGDSGDFPQEMPKHTACVEPHRRHMAEPVAAKLAVIGLFCALFITSVIK